MTVFQSSEQAVAVFREMFDILLADEHFSSRIAAGNLDLHLGADQARRRALHRARRCARRRHPTPTGDLAAHVVRHGARPVVRPAVLPLALATGKLRVKGPVSKVLEFVPLLQPAFDRYPGLAADAGLPA
jgi:hypothetical protein